MRLYLYNFLILKVWFIASLALPGLFKRRSCLLRCSLQRLLLYNNLIIKSVKCLLTRFTVVATLAVWDIVISVDIITLFIYLRYYYNTVIIFSVSHELMPLVLTGHLQSLDMLIAQHPYQYEEQDVLVLSLVQR